ncbi:hypothetical protein D3C86_2175180 [compost metagenome]
MGLVKFRNNHNDLVYVSPSHILRLYSRKVSGQDQTLINMVDGETIILNMYHEDAYKLLFGGEQNETI